MTLNKSFDKDAALAWFGEPGYAAHMSRLGSGNDCSKSAEMYAITGITATHRCTSALSSLSGVSASV